MENIGGIFVVLICGLIIAVFVAVMEFVWSTRRSAETDEVRPLSCDRQYHSHTTVGYHGDLPTPQLSVCRSPSQCLCHGVHVYLCASRV